MCLLYTKLLQWRPRQFFGCCRMHTFTSYCAGDGWLAGWLPSRARCSSQVPAGQDMLCTYSRVLLLSSGKGQETSQGLLQLSLCTTDDYNNDDPRPTQP